MIDLPSLIEKCSSAKHIMFVTGAGISSGSGLPTYRGKNGIYTNKLIPAELIMNAVTFKYFPSLVWGRFREAMKVKAEPNNAHITIAAMEYLVDKITVVTQNVDNLHNEAGSTDVIELHGNATKMACSKCGMEYSYVDINTTPKCRCSGVIRPNVVLFGENLPAEAVNRYQQVADLPDVVIAVGTTANFDYILDLFRKAKSRGATTALIDLQFSNNLSGLIDCWVNEKAEVAIPYIANQMWKSKYGTV